MLNILQHLHSVNRWVVLVLLILTIITAFQGWFGKKGYTEGDRKKALFTLIFSHIQLILGLGLYFISPFVKNGGGMKDAVWRFYAVEHLAMMVIAIILVTVGYSLAKKKATDLAKFKTTAIYYTIALLIILAGIPWPFRAALGGGWY
jgi:predicted permease